MTYRPGVTLGNSNDPSTSTDALMEAMISPLKMTHVPLASRIDAEDPAAQLRP